MLRRMRFGQQPSRPTCRRGQRKVRRAIQRQNQNQHARKARKNAPRGVQPVHHRHVHVQNNQLRLQHGTLLDRFQAIRSFSTDLPARLGLQQSANHLPNVIAIVNDENLNQGAASKRESCNTGNKYN